MNHKFVVNGVEEDIKEAVLWLNLEELHNLKAALQIADDQEGIDTVQAELDLRKSWQETADFLRTDAWAGWKKSILAAAQSDSYVDYLDRMRTI